MRADLGQIWGELDQMCPLSAICVVAHFRSKIITAPPPQVPFAARPRFLRSALSMFRYRLVGRRGLLMGAVGDSELRNEGQSTMHNSTRRSAFSRLGLRRPSGVLRWNAELCDAMPARVSRFGGAFATYLPLHGRADRPWCHTVQLRSLFALRHCKVTPGDARRST